MSNIQKKCENIAFRTLLDNQRDNLYLLAGSSLYSDMWTRDAFISSLGLLAHDAYPNIIKNVLQLQSDNIRNDGLIPLRIGRKSYLTKLLCGCYSDNRSVPIYKDDKKFNLPTDSNPQFIILNYLYLQATQDYEFINNNIESIIKCYDYIWKNLKDQMLQGKYFHSWYDTFSFNGPDLFSNVLFIYSIKCFQKFIDDEKIPNIKNKDIYKPYEIMLESFKNNFWNGTYFKISPKIDVMETAGNSFAILFDFITKEESLNLVKFIEDNNDNQHICSVTIPKMPRRYLWKPLCFVGMMGYHNDRYWLWPHFIYITALKKLKVEKSISEIQKTICNNFTFPENVDKNINIYKHCFQNSEINFSESCGSYLLSTGKNIFDSKIIIIIDDHKFDVTDYANDHP